MKTLQDLAEELGRPRFVQMALQLNKDGIFALTVSFAPDDPVEGLYFDQRHYFIRPTTGELIPIEPFTMEGSDAALAEAMKPV